MGNLINKTELEILERKFDTFLNLTIIGASKDYYKKERKHHEREITILDDESLEQRKEKIIEEICQKDIYDEFGPFSENFKLNIAFESLSDVEQMVIFLYFKKKYKSNEIAKIMRITVQSVSRIKKRAIRRMKSFIEEMNDYE